MGQDGDGGKLQRQRALVARRLEDLIRDSGESMHSLEGKMGLSRGYLGEALSGRKRLTVELAVQVLDALSLPVRALFTLPQDGELAEETTTYDRRFSTEEVELVRQAVGVVIQRMLGR